MFGPLLFATNSPKPHTEIVDKIPLVKCILCQNEFIFPDGKEEFLTHLFLAHKLIIADVEKISNFPKYLLFWKAQFAQSDLKEFCSVVLADINKDGVIQSDQEYFLLSDVLPMDKELREGLHKELLESAVEQQRREREDREYCRGCLFCREEVRPSREEYLNHLSGKHNLQLGRPHNLVYVDLLLDTIQAKLEALQCIYCEKEFKDRGVLKEHMRKKQHKRVNPSNRSYDQFYMVNYLEPGAHDKVRSRRDSGDEPASWSDWQEELQLSIVCLFCEKTAASWEGVTLHMSAEHGFNYSKKTASLGFYDQVKLVNYIRRQVYKSRCVWCDEELGERGLLLEHMESVHQFATLPPRQLWDQPSYYFPTYENDAFLCQIEADDTDSVLSDAMGDLEVTAAHFTSES